MKKNATADKLPMKITIDLFESASGSGFHFRGVAENGEIVFQSEEYTRRGDAKRAAKSIASATFEVIE
jgi:uncharacterized protein YegP (UPF0339 family)